MRVIVDLSKKKINSSYSDIEKILKEFQKLKNKSIRELGINLKKL